MMKVTIDWVDGEPESLVIMNVTHISMDQYDWDIDMLVVVANQIEVRQFGRDAIRNISIVVQNGR